MSYLVTGGTGLVGSHIVRLLIQDGEEVIAYSRTPNIKLLEQLMGKEKSDQVKVVSGDINDLAYLISTCQEHKVDRIIHTASATSPNPAMLVRVNCEGTVNVLETAKILGMKRAVVTSSLAVFGPPESHKEEYIPNDAPHYPVGIYGATKSFIEACAKQYFNDYGVDVIAIRFPGVYGEGQTSRGAGIITHNLFVKPALGQPGTVPCNDTNNWLYADDAARVEVMASRVPTTKTRTFTVSGDIRSMAEVADYVKSLIPGADITVLPNRFGFISKVDTTPAKEEISFQYEWTLEKGVKKLIEFIQQHNRPV